MAAERPNPAAGVIQQIQDYAIIALDLQGIIRSWNLGAERVKGYSAGEVIGRHFSIFYPEADRRAGLPERLLELARTEGRVEHLGWRVRKDGTRFWGDVVITAVHDDAGRHTGFVKVTRDLTEQHTLEEALRQSEERLRVLVGQVQDYAIIALDPQGVIESWNLGAERLKGFTAEEALGRSFAMFYPTEDQAAGLPMQLLDQARERGRVEHAGWRVRKDGTRFWADVVITALHDDRGNLTGYAKVTRDRTELKRLQMAQDAFYANFSHDFRTPLTAIQGFAEAIRFTEGADREHMIERLQANTARLLTMVEDLMEFATQRREPGLELAELDLAEVVETVVGGLAPALNPERVRMNGVPVAARANAVAMQRVVTNLLVNALTYSPDDAPVEVRVATAADGSPIVEVVDHGRGVDPEDLDVIFNEFERGRRANDDEGGTGLGLASVRELVGQQSGDVQMRSQVGVGTTVTVTLPPPTPASIPQQSRARGPGDRRRGSEH